MAPVPSAPQPQLRCPLEPEGCCEPDRLAVAPSTPGCPLASNASAGLRLRRPPEGDRRPGLTRRPLRSPVAVADSSLPPPSRRSPTARSEVAVNTVRDPTSLSPRERCGLGRSPPPHRSGWRALSGTRISKYVSKPLVKGYFEKHRVIPETFSLPPGFLPSSTRYPPFMHSDAHRLGPHLAAHRPSVTGS